MITGTLIQYLLTGAGGAIILAVVNAILNRAKSKADTGKVIMEASETVFKQMTEYNTGLNKRIVELEEEIKYFKKDHDNVRHILQMQNHWIVKVHAILTPEQREVVGPLPDIAEIE